MKMYVEMYIRPTKEECHRNSRAKSTKMRWAIKAKIIKGIMIFGHYSFFLISSNIS